jgi:hypothetical protein
MRDALGGAADRAPGDQPIGAGAQDPPGQVEALAIATVSWRMAAVVLRMLESI